MSTTLSGSGPTHNRVSQSEKNYLDDDVTRIGLITAVIPAFNEAGRIGKVIQNTLKYVDAVLVIDDDSLDETVIEARSAGAHVISQSMNMGYIQAIKRGFQEAKGDIVVTLDADGEFSPDDIPRLVAPIVDGKADMVQGRRDIAVRLSEQILTWLAGQRTFVGDSGTGFRAIRTEMARQLNLNGACICGIFSLEVANLGGRISEVPVHLQSIDKKRKIAWYHVLQFFYLIPWLFKPQRFINEKKQTYLCLINALSIILLTAIVFLFLIYGLSPGLLTQYSYYDFIANRHVTERLVDPSLFKVESWNILDQTKDVLFTHPAESGSTALVYPAMIQPRTTFRTDIAIAPEAWQGEGDGVVFSVYVEDDAGMHLLYSQYVDPKHHQADRNWLPVQVNLSRYQGELVRIILATGSGPAGDRRYDWAGWGNPVLTQPAWLLSIMSTNTN